MTKRKLNKLALYFALLIAFIFLLLIFYVIHFQNGIEQVNKQWQLVKVDKIENFGTTKSLAILPLVNWHTSQNSLKGEAGVSYLIKTDEHTLLFDLGFNANNENPSPLEHNMANLGIDIDDIDSLFLSHHHLDHNGGQQWVNKQSFSLGVEQISLKGKKVFAPLKLNYPEVEVKVTAEPTIIGKGIASIGAISRQLFIGKVAEQALAIHVEGEGIVIIVGCGHQTLPKILQRTKQLFDQPIYGLVGDLHYPVPEGKLNFLGINLQRTFASGLGPHRVINQQTIHNEIALLKRENPSLVALGGHDTSDEVIEQFSHTFADNYRYVRVGEWIEFDVH